MSLKDIFKFGPKAYVWGLVLAIPIALYLLPEIPRNINTSLFEGSKQPPVSAQPAKQFATAIPQSTDRANETALISGPGAPGFNLEPNQSLGNWLEVEAGLKYSFTSDGPGFSVHYKRGDTIIIEAGQTNVPIPSYAGPFKIVAGNQKVRVTVIISRVI
jgi:hypothetical protein